MRQYFLLIITCLLAVAVYGQSQKTSCNCPANEMTHAEPDTSFKFSNGKTIVLCGYIDTETKPITFSEFVLAVCGQDTVIDFWGALFTGEIKFKKDTLSISELLYLPVGKNFAYKQTVWTIEKIYFTKQKLVRSLQVNRQILKYSKEKISSILKEYETANSEIDENKIELANKLFIATISGSKLARKYFEEFELKFSLDGDFGEQYMELTAMLRLWDKKK